MLATLLLLIDSEEDQRKFEMLYHQYKQLMFYIARDYFHKGTAVEDAVQEAFIRIIKNFSKIGDINCPQTKHFIVIVVKSTCIDLLRTGGKREGADISWEDIPESEGPEQYKPDDALEQQESYERLLEALRALPQAHRDVLTLRYIHKLPFEQISSITGFSMEYVKKLLQRGRKRLEKELEAKEVT